MAMNRMPKRDNHEEKKSKLHVSILVMQLQVGCLGAVDICFYEHRISKQNEILIPE